MVTIGPITLGVCSGTGMLEEALRLVFPGCRCAALCEWEAYAAATLLARMEDASMEPAPVWCGDLRDFPATGFRGLVDIITAGLPCQPYSCAGRREGNTDHRSFGEDGSGPIPGFLRIVEAVRPALVFCENVPAWIRGGWFRPVGDELCRMGYEIGEPVFLAAEDVGASHKRERVFVEAHLPGERGSGEQLDNPTGARRDGAGQRPDNGKERGGQCVSGEGCAAVGNTTKHRSEMRPQLHGRNDGKGFGQGCNSFFAPGPASRDWPGILAAAPHLAPAVEPGIRGVVDGLAVVVDEARADQLRCIGNGVVALQAAVALVELLRRLK